MKDFLDYLVDHKTCDAFTSELNQAVEETRKHEKWRGEFMTLLMRDQENQEIGKEIGKEIGQHEKLMELVKKKMEKGYKIHEIANALEEKEEVIEKLMEEITKRI